MQYVRKLDLFRSVQDDEKYLTPPTKEGAYATLITAALLGLLLLSECWSYASGHRQCSMALRPPVPDAAEVSEVNFLINFHSLPCDRVKVQMFRRNAPIASPQYENSVQLFHTPSKRYSQSRSKPYIPNQEGPPQHNGCLVEGSAPLEGNEMTLAISAINFTAAERQTIMASHRFFSFIGGGADLAGTMPHITKHSVEPLTDTTHAAPGDGQMWQFFQYHVNFVRTSVSSGEGKRSQVGYQYTSASTVGSTARGPRFPGIYINYRTVPFGVECTTSYDTPSHFFVHLCAVAGGVFVVAGFLEQAAEEVGRRRRMRERSQRHAVNTASDAAAALMAPHSGAP